MKGNPVPHRHLNKLVIMSIVRQIDREAGLDEIAFEMLAVALQKELRFEIKQIVPTHTPMSGEMIEQALESARAFAEDVIAMNFPET